MDRAHFPCTVLIEFYYNFDLIEWYKPLQLDIKKQNMMISDKNVLVYISGSRVDFFIPRMVLSVFKFMKIIQFSGYLNCTVICQSG